MLETVCQRWRSQRRTIAVFLSNSGTSVVAGAAAGGAVAVVAEAGGGLHCRKRRAKVTRKTMLETVCQRWRGQRRTIAVFLSSSGTSVVAGAAAGVAVAVVAEAGGGLHCRKRRAKVTRKTMLETVCQRWRGQRRTIA